MGKKRKLVVLLIVICIMTTMLPSTSLEEYEASEKVGSELLGMLDVSYEELRSGDFVDSGEKYSCIIWIEDVEIEEAVEAGIDAAEMIRENYSVSSSYDYPYTSYDSEGLTYVAVELDDEENDEYVQAYIETERAAAVELYTESNNSFVAENFMARDMSVTYVSQYSPCIFAELSITKIAELTLENEVMFIDCVSGNDTAGQDIGGIQDVSSGMEPTLEMSEIEKAMEIATIDLAIKNYNVTGDGIKIGQLESTCPDSDDVYKNPNYNNTEIAGTATAHADDVYLIMSTVAPDATYYATGRYTDNDIEDTTDESFFEQIEWLLGQGVNIINVSYGFRDYNSYDARSKWIDHIAYNHDVHFVMAAGNEAKEGVRSPGMAYNIITVGVTEREYPYDIIYNSEYDGSSYVEYAKVSRTNQRTYKPDLVAPGEYSSDWGTSYAAPLVTGSIALMCDYKPALKTQQFNVKAILAATTSKANGTYVTSNEEFCMYGAGMIDIRSAMYAIYAGKYSISTGSLVGFGETKTYNMKVTSSDTNMRIALAYGNRIEFESDSGTHAESDTPTAGLIGSLEFRVYSPNDELVVSCVGNYLGQDGNLKIVEFDPRDYEGAGTYTITVRVIIPASDGRTTNFGVAWR